MVKKANKHIWVKNIAMIGVIIAFLFIAVNIFLKVVTKHNNELIVPDFTNMPLTEAQHLAKEAHLRLEVTDSVYIKRMARGHISRQNPDAGSYVKKGRRILLTINSVSPQMVQMPDLVGYSLRQAKTEIISNGLKVGKLIYKYDIATNNVLQQMVANDTIAPGVEIETDTPIDLVLGMNISDTTTYIPNVMGYKLIIATDLLQDNSLNIQKISFDETVIDYSDSLNAMVYMQIPAYSDSIQYKLGTGVEIFLTKDESKIVIEEPKTEGEEGEEITEEE
jgi:beta-lactam-binding protein with PASTA domain